MKRVIVIGGSGHVGTFLVPRLVEAGYFELSPEDVVALESPYRQLRDGFGPGRILAGATE